MTTTAQIILSILTVVCSGIVAAIVAHKLNVHREEVSLCRRKLEQLYMAYSGFCTLLASMYSPFLPAMEGKISYNDALDVQIAGGKRNSERDYEKMRMLVTLYFPHLSKHVKELEAVREDLNSLVAASRNFSPNGSPFAKSFEKAWLKTELLNEEFAKVICKEAKQLHKRKFKKKS